MTAATLQFGPEWMRTKPQAPRSQVAPSPPPQSNAPPTASSYSSLVTPAPHPSEEKRDSSKPFKYSKEDMLRIYKESGGRGGLGLEVERWEGIVREGNSEPAALREWTEAEKKVVTRCLIYVADIVVYPWRTALCRVFELRNAQTAVHRLFRNHICDLAEWRKTAPHAQRLGGCQSYERTLWFAHGKKKRG
ncbi:hypothetical protein OE88DRAFT_161529 [Heliocybe sulcata]|uniref:Uncharacterized protein n=1 Tax=Heliocybe sulcata TaxID=5364 RepID=A0A5C3NJU7_9AGAM|nr:hypothetical protein OE88DRAFT_161529 [Heliocybe sulcata]